MGDSNFFLETHFHGDAMEWLGQIPEEEIDKIIKILEIDPKEPMVPTGYSTEKFRHLELFHTTKMCLWSDLVYAINRWGLPAPTELGTTPKELKNHLQKITNSLLNAKKTLRSLEYEQVFLKGTMSKEFIVSNGLRQSSKVIKSSKENRNATFLGSSVIAAEIKEDKNIKLYPLDHYLEEAISSIDAILESAQKLSHDKKYIPPPKGTSKKGKENANNLFWNLCIIFKKYTGKNPTAYVDSINEDVVGEIIPFLMAVLPLSHYGYRVEKFALEKKIREIKKDPKFKSLWEDAKS